MEANRDRIGKWKRRQIVLLLAGLLWLVPGVTLAQNCYDYPCVIRKAKAALAAKRYQSAFDNLESAAAYPGSNTEEIADLRQQLFNSIQREKEQAETERQRAEQAEGRVRSTLRIVQEERDRSEVLRKAAERNSEINRITAQAMELQAEDPGLAANLAHYAFELSDRGHPLAAKIRRNLYQDPTVLLLRTTLRGHRAEVTAMAFSPDGRYILTGSKDRTAILWDFKGTILRHFTGHTGSVTAVAFAPDGRRVITGSQDHSLKLWELEGQEIRTFSGHLRAIKQVVFSTDGKLILSEAGDGLRLWQVSGEELTANFEESRGRLEAVSFTDQDNKIVGVDTYGAVKKWDRSGQLLDKAEMKIDNLLTAAFSQRGDRLLVNSIGGKTLLWATESNSVEREMPDLSAYRAAGFSAVDDHIMIARTEGIMEAWEWSGRKRGSTRRMGSAHTLTAAVFSGDGRWMLSLSPSGLPKLWDLSVGSELMLGGHREAISSMVATPDGSLIATAGRAGEIRLWDAEGQLREVMPAHDRSVETLAFAPDGQSLLSGSLDHTVKLWDRNGRLLQTFEEQEWGIKVVKFFPDGKKWLSAAGSELSVWDVTGRLLAKYSAPFNIAALDIAPDGQQMVLAGGEGRVVRLSPDGKLLAEFQTTPVPVFDLAFSPNGQELLLGLEREGAVLLDLGGQLLQHLDIGPSSVLAVTFAPVCENCAYRPGELLLTGSADGTVMLWNRLGLELQRSDQGPKGISDLAFTPDGTRILVGKKDHNAVLLGQVEAYFGKRKAISYPHCTALGLPFDYQKLSDPGMILEYGSRYLEENNTQQDMSPSELDAAREVMEFLVDRFGDGYRIFLAEVRYNYARYHFRRGAFTRAIDAYEKVMELDPSARWLDLELATTWLFAGNWSQTKTIYDRWLGQAWDHSVSDYARNWGEAFYKYLDQASESVPPRDEALVTRAKNYLLEAMSK